MASTSARVRNTLEQVASALYNAFDRAFPANTREDVRTNISTFAGNNPKSAAFLALQIAFSGFPFLSLLAFALTVFICSLVAALLFSILAAILFTIVCVLVSLLLAVPVLVFTIFVASSLFTVGLVGFTIIQWFKNRNVAAGEKSVIGHGVKLIDGGRTSVMRTVGRHGHDHSKTHHGNTSKENTQPGADNSSKKMMNAETHHAARPSSKEAKHSERLDTAETAITGPEVFDEKVLQRSQELQ